MDGSCGNGRDAGARNEVVSSRCRSDASSVRAYQVDESQDNSAAGTIAGRMLGSAGALHSGDTAKRCGSGSSLRKERCLIERGVIPALSWHDIRHLGSYEASFPNRTGVHGDSGLSGQFAGAFMSRKGHGCEAIASTTVRNRGGGARLATRMPETGTNMVRAPPAARCGGSSTRGAARR